MERRLKLWDKEDTKQLNSASAQSVVQSEGWRRAVGSGTGAWMWLVEGHVSISPKTYVLAPVFPPAVV